NQGGRTVSDVSATALAGVSDRVGRNGCVRPTSRSKLILGARDVEIGDGDEMHAPRRSHLAEKHRAEFAGADQADGDRPSGCLALEQHGVKVHVILIAKRAAVYAFGRLARL